MAQGGPHITSATLAASNELMAATGQAKPSTLAVPSAVSCEVESVAQQAGDRTPVAKESRQPCKISMRHIDQL